MFKMKNILDGINTRSDAVKESICKVEDVEIETIQNEKQTTKTKRRRRINRESMTCRANSSGLVYVN